MKRRRKETERKSSQTIVAPLSKKTVGFVVRIHAGRHSSATIKAELKGLGLMAKYDAVFAELSEEVVRK